jgi:hypothetical protein
MTPEQFTENSVAAVASLGLYFVGMPDDQMRHTLLRIRDNLETDLEDSFGEEAAAKFADEFVKAILAHRSEIGGGASIISRTLH